MTRKLNQSAQKLGFDLSSSDLFHLENNCIQNTPAKTDQREVISYREAIKKYPDLKKRAWKLISPDKDEITQAVFHAKDTDGYFIRSFARKQKPRETTTVSVTTCLSTTENKFTQNVHNIIVAEKNSDLNIITGCITPYEIESNLHKGITEIYVEEGATVTFTMIHAWNKGSEVKPRTAVNVAKGGKFISNYVLISPVASLDTNPQIYLSGENSIAQLNSFVYSYENSKIDLGGTIHLNDKNSRGTINSSIVIDGGDIKNRGTLIGNSDGIFAHLECNAIILKPCFFETVPILQATLPNLDMSHEASIGKINQDEIEYLQSKGLSASKASQIIIGGFIDTSIQKLNLPVSLDILGIAQMSKEGI